MRNPSATGELFGITLSKANKSAIILEAHKNGWQQMNKDGRYATVLVKDDQALKIFADSAYLEFLDELVLPSKNDLFPIILEGPIIGRGLAAIFLERLEPLSLQDKKIADHLGILLDVATDEDVLDAEPFRVDAVRERMGQNGLDTLAQIADLVNRLGLRGDISTQNLMRRPNTNELVFTDPVQPEY